MGQASEGSASIQMQEVWILIYFFLLFQILAGGKVFMRLRSTQAIEALSGEKNKELSKQEEREEGREERTKGRREEEKGRNSQCTHFQNIALTHQPKTKHTAM